MQALRDNLAGGVRRQRDEISMDHIQEWAALIGRRNIAYVGFVSLLVPFGMLMEAAGPQGPDSGGGIMAAMVSLIYL
jgi:hypothetical protein